jgi:hypothetical protein
MDFVEFDHLAAAEAGSGSNTICSIKSLRSIAPSRRTNIGLMFTVFNLS